MPYDVVIVGGGPAGLSAALNLGRARKRVLLCDAGPRRNAAAVHIHGFVTQDGTPPAEFRRVGRRQLERYPNVGVRDTAVVEIGGERGAFRLRLTEGEAEARRILLCTGMIDVLPEIEGFRALWGKSIFQCPYCHGWEVQDRRFGFLSPSAEMIDFAIFLRGWSRDVTLLTDGRFAVPEEARARFESAGVAVEEGAIGRLREGADGLEAVELTDGGSLPLDVLFARPLQRQVPVVEALGPALDAGGYVVVDEQRRTSIPGIYAAGDLLTAAQSATLAAAAGVQAAAQINHELTMELAANGLLP